MFAPCYAPHRPIRHSVSLACQVVRERDFRLVADRITNLSVGGMLVGPADPVLTGEKLIVSFQLPSWGTWVDAEAVVCRVIHGRRPGEQIRCLGVVFEGLDTWSRFVLERNLSWAPVAPPAPRPRGTQALARLIRTSGYPALPLN